MPRFQQNGFEIPNRFTAKPSASKKATKASISLCDLRLLHNLALCVHNANARQFNDTSIRHNAPWRSPSPDAWGRLQRRDPVYHLSGDSHINHSLRAGPITASSMPLHFAYGSNMSRALMRSIARRRVRSAPRCLLIIAFIVMADGYASIVRRPGHKRARRAVATDPARP